MEVTHDNDNNIPGSPPVTCRLITALEAAHRDFHFHENYEIYLLLEGEIAYYVEQSRCTMKPGDLILFTDQEIHKAVNLLDTPYTRMVIHVDPLYVWKFCTSQTNLLRGFHQHRPGVNNIISLTSEQLALFQECFEQLRESSESHEYGTDIKGMTALLRLLMMINESFLFLPDKEAAFYEHRLQPVMVYIDEHLSEPISLDDVAQVCSLDKYYLSHLFKRETGSTIFQYILVKRIARAKELLSMGTSVSDSCIRSGFGDYANFIRTFKKVTGFSPGYFKKMSRDAQ